jgi:4-oxalocrotonate tautomerase
MGRVGVAAAVVGAPKQPVAGWPEMVGAGLADNRGGEGAMPEITIEMIEGRTVDQKRELARRLTDVMVEVLKVDASSVTIIFHENRRQDKAKAGLLFLDR